MSKALRLRFILCAALACLPVSAGFAPAQAQSNNAGDVIASLIDLQGQVSVRRRGWREFQAAAFGMELRRGDVLKVGASSRATVYCAERRYELSTGLHPVPCKGDRPIGTGPAGNTMPTRSDAQGLLYPQVISPRKTKLLNDRPELRWTAVAGAKAYRVVVRGPNVNWSAEVSGKTELVYPGDAPTLVAGAPYRLTVVAGERSSDEEGQPGLGFTLLNAEEAQALRAEEAGLRAQGLQERTARFLTAQLYASRGLYAEAIEILEELSKSWPESSLERALGALYLRTGLNRLAEAHYLQAVALSQKAKDLEGEALAQSALGAIYEAIGNGGEAVERWQRARDIFRGLGDVQAVKQLEERLGTQRP